MSMFEFGARSSPTSLTRAVTCCGALFALTPAAAFAQLALIGTGNGQYEYNTNVFGLPPGGLTPENTTERGDSLFAYGGKLDATYEVSQQQFHLVLLGTEYRYDRFTFLDHSEFTLDGSWNLRFGDVVDGLIEVDRNRTLVSLFNLINNEQLALQTEQRETAKFGVAITPDWRAEAGGYTRKVESPLVGTPDLALSENSGEAAVKYTGTAGVTAGLEGGYLHGDYSGNTQIINAAPVILVPAYKQYNAALTATDAISGLSTFVGQIGYSKRSNAASGFNSGANNVSGVTGLLDYRRALTGKTTIEEEASRVVATFLVGAGSEIDTIGNLNAIWQATNKIGVVLGYNFTYRDLPDQGTVPGTTRTDRLNFISLNVDYEQTRWLSLKPYINYQTRASTNFYYVVPNSNALISSNFNATAVGLKFSLQWEHGEQPQPQPFQIPPFQF
jgi:hypothetical protein